MDPTDGHSNLLHNVSNYLIYHAKFEFTTTVLLKIQVFWNVMGNTDPVIIQCYVAEDTYHWLITSAHDTISQ
jgi:hypothetical protein